MLLCNSAGAQVYSDTYCTVVYEHGFSLARHYAVILVYCTVSVSCRRTH